MKNENNRYCSPDVETSELFLGGGVLCSSSYYDDLYSDNEWYEDEEEIEGWF